VIPITEADLMLRDPAIQVERSHQENKMSKIDEMIHSITDDELDAVSGGRPDLYQGGNKPPGYGTTPGGLQNTGTAGTGITSLGQGVLYARSGS
jgi:hypothetical protein